MIFFGETPDSRQEVSQGVLSWGVNKVMDTAGNYYSVEYVRDAPGTEPFDFVNDRVSAIHYTGNAGASMAPLCRLHFDYETRSDVSRAHTTYAGYKVTKRLSAIRVMTGSHTNHSHLTPNLMNGVSWLLLSILGSPTAAHCEPECRERDQRHG